MMASRSDLEEVFESFCSFGAGSKDSGPMMDNAKFAKMFRDLKLLDKKFTETDVDIIFNRPEVKSKVERKITFSQFLKALKLVAEKKYPGDTEGMAELERQIISGKGPKTIGTKESVDPSVDDRLTDTSKYTGSHKERFDESGKGKGLSGREWDINTSEGYVGGYKQ